MTEKETLLEIVKKVLQQERRARLEPNWCVWRIMRYYGVNISFQEFIRLPKFESILKARRELMNKRNEFPEEFTPEEGVTYEPKIKLNLTDKPLIKSQQNFRRVVL